MFDSERGCRVVNELPNSAGGEGITYVDRVAQFQPSQPAQPPALPPPPLPPLAPCSVSVDSGPCSLTKNGTHSCVTSPGFPGDYPNDKGCTITCLPPANTVEAFEVEEETSCQYDYLEVNGVKYCGTSGPPNGEPAGAVQWVSDFSVTAKGWKARVHPLPAPPTPTPNRRTYQAPYAADLLGVGEWVLTIGAAVLDAVAAATCAACGLATLRGVWQDRPVRRERPVGGSVREARGAVLLRLANRRLEEERGVLRVERVRRR